jgi:outer membrane protein
MILRILTALLLTACIALAETPFPLINSDQPLGLDTLVAIGFANSPSLKQTTLDTKLNTIGKMNAVGNFLPSVSLGMTFSQTHYRTTTYMKPDGSVGTYPIAPQQYTDYQVVWADTGADGSLSNPHLQQYTYSSVGTPILEGDSRNSSIYLSLSETIFEGGRRYFLYRLAHTQANINSLNVVEAKKSLAGGIAQQVMLVNTQEKLLDLNKKLRDQQKDAYDLAKARFDVGAVTELDVLQAEILLNTAENNVTTAERDLQAQRETLNQTLGIDLRSSFPIAEAGPISPYTFDIDQLVTEAYRNRTDLQVAGLSVDRSQYNVNMNKSDYLPVISLGAQFSRSEQSGKQTDWTLSPRNRNNAYSLSLRWNLFDGFTREYNVQTQRVARDKIIEQERQLQLSVAKDVRDAYYNLEKVYDQLRITNRNRDLAERTLNLERERYRLGAASALDLRDAQVTYAKAETDNLQKILESQSSLIALELAVGKSLR